MKPGIVLVLAITAGMVSLLICWKVLGLIPHISDEVSYSFQGKILASGRLWLDPPPVPQAFAVDHILSIPGRWCSIYTAGWPLLLAGGWLIGMPWIVNPLLLIGSIFGIWTLGVNLFDDRTALLAVVLFVISPFVLLMGAGFMSHMAALCASVWCLVALSGEQTRGRLVIAGLMAGFTFLIRPFTAIALLWPAILWCLWGRKKQWIRAMSLLLLGFLPSLFVFFLYNDLLFGGPLKTGYDLDPSWHVIQFHTSQFGKNFAWYIKALNGSLWGWPSPSLLLLVFLLRPRSGWRRDLMLAVCSISLIGTYSLLSYRDIVYSGPRYVFEAVGLLSLLTARSIYFIFDLIRNFRIARAVLIGVLFCLILFSSAHRFLEQIPYHSQIYHGQTAEVFRMAESAGLGENALIFVSGDPYIFRSFFFENRLNPSSGERVFVRDLPNFRGEIEEAFLRHEVWRVTVNLQPLQGPNSYPDHFLLKEFGVERLK